MVVVDEKSFPGLRWSTADPTETVLRLQECLVLPLVHPVMVLEAVGVSTVGWCQALQPGGFLKVYWSVCLHRIKEKISTGVLFRWNLNHSP